jgi:hypothetical protein
MKQTQIHRLKIWVSQERWLLLVISLSAKYTPGLLSQITLRRHLKQPPHTASPNMTSQHSTPEFWISNLNLEYVAASFLRWRYTWFIISMIRWLPTQMNYSYYRLQDMIIYILPGHRRFQRPVPNGEPPRFSISWYDISADAKRQAEHTVLPLIFHRPQFIFPALMTNSPPYHLADVMSRDVTWFAIIYS